MLKAESFKREYYAHRDCVIVYIISFQLHETQAIKILTNKIQTNAIKHND